jgi:hypothetical protein
MDHPGKGLGFTILLSPLAYIFCTYTLFQIRIIHQYGCAMKESWVAILRICSLDKLCTCFIDRKNESSRVDMSQILVMRNFEKLEYG